MVHFFSPSQYSMESLSLRNRRRVGLLLLFLAAVFLILGILAWQHPSDYGIFPSCPFHTATGLLCPGCGSMRAVHFLLHGDFFMSLWCNPLVLPMTPLIAFLLFKWFYEWFFVRIIPFPCQKLVGWSVVVIFLLFFVARNIPVEFLEFLRPPARLDHATLSFLNHFVSSIK